MNSFILGTLGLDIFILLSSNLAGWYGSTLLPTSLNAGSMKFKLLSIYFLYCTAQMIIKNVWVMLAQLFRTNDQLSLCLPHAPNNLSRVFWTLKLFWNSIYPTLKEVPGLMHIQARPYALKFLPCIHTFISIMVFHNEKQKR